MDRSRPTLSVHEKLSYGLGDFGANLVFQSQITFLLFFYTDVFGISAATAGTILLSSRIVDAFSGPIIGAISDRTDSRWGKYRPWLLWTAVPLAIAFVLCYTTPEVSQSGKVVWAAVTCTVLMIVYAANNIPYCALAGVMTDDSSERTSLLSWRFIFVMVAAFGVNTFTIELVKRFGGGDDASGFRSAIGTWAVLAAGCFVITFAFTRERISKKYSNHAAFRQVLSDLLYNGPWVSLFAMAVLIHVQLAFRGGGMLYYFKHFLNREDLFGWFNGIGLAAAVIGVSLSNPLAARVGKRTAFQMCLLVSAALLALFALLPRDWVWGLFALHVLFQLVFGPTIPLLWTMMADVADYTEWKTGRQCTALAFASIVFGMKLGLGIGSWLGGEWLGLSGYSSLSTQSPSALNGIVMLISIFPAIALILGFIALFVYPINERLEQQMRQVLRERRETSS
jgi:glycoside/pentoside/hexuronide:cation symporter, GPH family